MKKALALIVTVIMVFALMTSSFASENTYKVKSGDVLWKIAERYDTTWQEIAELNKLLTPHLIFPGQELNISVAKEITNSDKVISLLKSIETGDMSAVAFINPDKYIQHNLAVKDGLAGFGELLSQLPEGSAKVNTLRVIEDGNFVAAHTDYNFFGPKVGFDIFRFEDGLIVEHWDNLTIKSDKRNPSGRSQLDGTTVVKDLDKTDDNKELVANFVDDILVNGKMDLIGSYFDGDNYLQHNTQVADQVSGLGAALASMAENDIFMIYEKNHMIIGQGNFVLSVSEGTFAGEKVSYFDLFRVEDGKIAEHWDVIENIPSEDKWQNKNGKF